MKSRAWASLFAVMISFSCVAQNVTVRFKIKNDKNDAVLNATVQVMRVPDSMLLITKTFKADESFSLKKNADYFIRVSAVGINRLFQQIHTGNADTVISVTAQTKAQKLDAVIVTAKKPFVTQQDDKTVIDAEPLANASTNAFEVIEKTPGAIIDQDGNVYLNSTTPATIFINGREVKLSATDLASLLKSLPANSISKIEILRNPSAKYDAESAGGIVNIVLKKGVKLGLNGSMELTHFQGRYPTNTFGFSLNNSAKKMNSYLSGNLTRRTTYESLSSERPVGGIIFSQSSYTKYPSLNSYLGGGLDYQVNKKWSIGYDARFTGNDSRSDALNNIDIATIASNVHAGQNISSIYNSGPSFYLGNNISSDYKIDSAGSDWANSLDINFYRARNNQDYSNTFLLPAKNTVNGDGTTHNRRNIIAFKSDLLLKLKSRITIETGTKLSFSNNRNDAAYFADSTGIRYIDTYQTNNFRYHENIAALYLQASKSFGGFTLKPGLRLEYTDIAGHQLYPADTIFTIKRTDLFPYVYLRHYIAKMFGFKLNGNAIFRRSITRPSYEQLNPFPKLVDQYTFDIGNPELQPQFTTNYEVNVTADEFPIFSLGLNNIKSIFNNLTYQKDTILYRTFDNLGNNKEIYMRLTGGIPPGKKYFFYAGAQMNAVNYKGFYGNAPFRFKKTSWTFFMYQNYKPIPTLNISLNGFMRTNSVINFFELKTFGGLTVSANKSIWNKKMNIIVTVNDIFHSNKNEFEINVPGFTGTGMRYGDTRRAGLTVKYNFGLRPKEEKKESYDAPAQEAAP